MLFLICTTILAAFVIKIMRDDVEFYRRLWLKEREHNAQLFEKLTGIPATTGEAEVDWDDDVIGD